MADGRKNNKGVKGNKGGRPSKAEEQNLIEHLKPLHPKAMTAFQNALKDEEKWAVELFFKYFYGMPKQMVDVTTDGESLNQPRKILFEDMTK